MFLSLAPTLQAFSPRLSIFFSAYFVSQALPSVGMWEAPGLATDCPFASHTYRSHCGNGVCARSHHGEASGGAFLKKASCTLKLEEHIWLEGASATCQSPKLTRLYLCLVMWKKGQDRPSKSCSKQTGPLDHIHQGGRWNLTVQKVLHKSHLGRWGGRVLQTRRARLLSVSRSQIYMENTLEKIPTFFLYTIIFWTKPPTSAFV